MTSVGRVYVAAGAVLLFFVLWAVIAASPWASRPVDLRADALARRETAVRQRAALAQRRYEARWAAYRSALLARGAASAITPQPSAQIVQLPPVATTRSS